MHYTARLFAALLFCFQAAAPAAMAEDSSTEKTISRSYRADRPDNQSKQKTQDKPDISHICRLIASSAEKHGIPPNFFARLIWKESRFDHLAVSPVGAQGIAQFMPYTARERGLNNAFNIDEALPASAAFLKDLHESFGNWGLAAAAYNAGPARLANWLKNGGFLPLETENYVLSVTGKSVDHFSTGQELDDTPLDTKLAFEQACQRLPVIQSRARSMAQLSPYPWAVQVAGNFRHSAVRAQWNRLRKQNPRLLAGHEVTISRIRTPLGRKGIYAARIGANSRQAADALCSKLRANGGSCIIRKNR
ncbi:transglycosylase SLT domain-containing protein [Pseudochrobactrum sp. HB0163]|uniref:transglycosylase SLT domain-containing protein n=1 Tax=Pseudochrobactrum sp. HB0163 TaxID=3450708 RepID=UPI003F6DDA3A